MTSKPASGILATALALALAACDARQTDNNANEGASASAPTPSSAPTRSAPAESIIREDVLAETNKASTAPAPQPAQMTLSFADADGELPEAAATNLNEFLTQPVVARGGCIVISGHTDSLGSDAQNLRASERRGRLVAAYLVERGIAEKRLRVIALGERRPIAPNANPDGTDFPEGRARNRRVTIEARPPTANEQGTCSTGS